MLMRRGDDPVVTDSETATATARITRGWPIVVGLGSLVLVSTVVRFAVAQRFTTPWIAPDEMVYGLIGEGLWSHGTLTLRELAAPYYSVLTPALVGAPLAALDLEAGIQWARVLQALAMSLVAVPTFLWARRLMSPSWALAAAALVLTAPALHYSGFLMTEPLTLTVVTAALLALAQALETPSTWRYGVFLGWATAAAAVRLQALVLLPAFLLAALIDAAAAGDRARLRPIVRLGGLAVAVSVVAAEIVVLTGGELSSRRLLGAYTPLGEQRPVAADQLGEIAWHAFDLAVIGVGLATLATAALVGHVLTGRDRDPRGRAFASVAVAYLGLLVVQVGLFSASFVGHVAERYLVTALPLLSIGVCAWAARGAPRPPAIVLPVWAAIVAGAAFVPVSQLAAAGTLVNSPTPSALAALGSDGRIRVALVAIAVVTGLAVLLVPRRLAWLGVLAVGVGLSALSVESARRIDDASAHEDKAALGSAGRSWIDDAGLDGVTLLATVDRLWTATARTFFWNRGVDEVIRIVPARTPFPPVSPSVVLGDDGLLRDRDEEPLVRSLVLAPTTFVLEGEKVLERSAGDSQTYGMVAWRTTGPIRVQTTRDGFLPNGDFGGLAHVTVYGCRQGTLDVTIIGKTGDPVLARIDGIVVGTLRTPAETAVTHRIPAPPYADGTKACVFELDNPGFAGSTTIAFSPS
jgi:hypothetical protein